ncbi:MAG TPA: bifunctional demethylmenaquinone methyltransferase/2-methoxy-6-polyprenyl-1,4-benzoquinol methylase UbiE [Puia sp.]|nr:bifunctional demethylmenaquinone methyltransferase/2-methoxy-6-polyprenyl-1,4-benzoquinol methylase UbiE [Puia sp.]
MTDYSHDKVVPFEGSPLGKKQQVAEMFDQIAFRYDFLNHFLSGGIDVYWRKRAIRQLRGIRDSNGSGAAILDVATGTADMPILISKYLPEARITGVDISAGMLELGRQKVQRSGLQDRIALQTGDSEALPFPDNCFDAVTAAFGVRNFEDLERGLQEMKRVLRPGGKLVVLECSQPRAPVIRQLYLFYMRLLAPRIARMASSNREAYQYLNNSVQAFPEGERFRRILEAGGYTGTRVRRLSLGTCALYTGEKPAARN